MYSFLIIESVTGQVQCDQALAVLQLLYVAQAFQLIPCNHIGCGVRINHAKTSYLQLWQCYSCSILLAGRLQLAASIGTHGLVDLFYAVVNVTGQIWC